MTLETFPLEITQVTNWLEAEFRKRNVSVNVHTARAKSEYGWLHIPVYVQGVLNQNTYSLSDLEYVKTPGVTLYMAGQLDAHDVASLLQEVEDAWNYQEPTPTWKLLLIPAAN